MNVGTLYIKSIWNLLCIYPKYIVGFLFSLFLVHIMMSKNMLLGVAFVARMNLGNCTLSHSWFIYVPIHTSWMVDFLLFSNEPV